MFTPDKKMKKVLGTYGNYAYIFNDGLIIVEKKEIKIEDSYTTIEVWHIFPLEIKLSSVDYKSGWMDRSNSPKVYCLVIHNANIIANGFDSLEIAFNASSLGTKEHGINVHQIKFMLGYQEWRQISLTDSSNTVIYDSSIAIQPNPYDKWSPTLENTAKSIRIGLDKQGLRGYSVVIHGTLPDKEPESIEVNYKLLAVNVPGN